MIDNNQVVRSLRLAGAALVTVAVIAVVAGPAVALHQTSPAGAGRYRVRPGDTLSAIAHRAGVSVRAMAQANSLIDPNLIVIGRTLVIPAAAGGLRATPATPAPRPPAQHRGRSATLSTVVTTSGRRHPSGLTGRRLRLMPVFEHWAAHYGMRADLLKAICYLESGWQTRAVSSTGAVGIGQLMPETATFVRQLTGLRLTRWSASDNIHMSAKYLRWLLDHTGWNVRNAVASYYQGLGALRAHGMYADSVAYVHNVLALQTRF